VDLPVGRARPALVFPHFPTRHQAVIWRNWELVGPDRLAAVLGATERQVADLAADMGLRVPPKVNPRWLTRGYATIIRANWHLLPYDQLLTLLGWTPSRLDFALREDDFLWEKLGSLKPQTEPVRWRSLSDTERRATAALGAALHRHFAELDAEDGAEEPFAFLDAFQTHGTSGSAARRRGVSESRAERSPFRFRMMYSYAAVYGDPLSDESLDPYPDGLLARLAELGVNAVYLQAVLYTLVPWGLAPGLAEGWKTRIRNLRRLAARTRRFGIGLYLYLNEPRAMRPAFFEDHPELRGVTLERTGLTSLCTSVRSVQEHLRDSVETLFRRAPEVVGLFTISMSENLTHCHSKNLGAQCPRCSKRPEAEVVAEVNRLIAEGARRGKPDADVIVWTWGWDAAWSLQALDLLPPDVAVMCVSEQELPTRVGGIEGKVFDYSISQVGPGPAALAQWARARRRGLRAYAKVQANNSWECSAVPWLPVPDLVEQHLQNIRKAGVQGVMLSWTLGAWPGGNLALLDGDAVRLARDVAGPAAAPLVRQAFRAFSHAFREFPFHVRTLYCAPQNYGPQNLFFEKPTGYPAAMVGFPYDDLESWRADYPPEVLERQFATLAAGWKAGLTLLDKAELRVPKTRVTVFRAWSRMAWAAYAHFRSAALLTAFVRRRADPSPEARARVRAILTEERDLTIMLYRLMREDSRLGFEASNHYAYTANSLKEKVLNLERLLALYDGHSK
jgi:hypothetical protein